ncbi:MAG TPA: hypothetical protein VE868_03260 [Balneolaceae bacterium]|nr:hypothetical protein [Balneolaceae bacterium]
MNFYKKVLSLTAVFFLVAGAAFAQQQQKQLKSSDVSKKELHNFAKAATDVRTKSQKFRQQSQKLLKKNGLTPKRYQMIRMSKRNPKMADSLNITKKEKKAYKKVQPKIVASQKKMIKKLKNTVTNDGISWNRFRLIAQSLRSDKQLQQRYQKIMAQQMKSGSSQ